MLLCVLLCGTNVVFLITRGITGKKTAAVLKHSALVAEVPRKPSNLLAPNCHLQVILHGTRVLASLFLLLPWRMAMWAIPAEHLLCHR